MAAEVQEDLNKAQKRELKWERKQAKVKAAADAAGQTYVTPPKEEKNSPIDKMGKRKKRKLAALQLDGGADATAPTSSNMLSAKSKQQPEVLANGSTPGHADGTADQSKAEKKAAKKAKKASLADATATTAVEAVTAAAGAASTLKSKKKKKKTATKSSTGTNAVQPADSQPASPAPLKKQKKAAASAAPAPTPTPHGRVRAHQEAVLASVGDQELAKSGKTILKDLYQEHSSVTGMTTEEVTKHRADRDTAVTGVDLRPVLQFDQAGSRARSFSAPCAFCTVFMVTVFMVLNLQCLASNSLTVLS